MYSQRVKRQAALTFLTSSFSDCWASSRCRASTAEAMSLCIFWKSVDAVCRRSCKATRVLLISASVLVVVVAIAHSERLRRLGWRRPNTGQRRLGTVTAPTRCAAVPPTSTNNASPATEVPDDDDGPVADVPL